MKILLLDTATPTCKLSVVIDDQRFDYTWQSDRQLARDLLAYIRDSLAKHQLGLKDLEAIGVMQGPGSFTGLRIGITVCNTLARQMSLPIVGQNLSENWQNLAIDRLKIGEDQKIVMPDYGSEPNITKPRK